ncbi:MAG TPA: aspartate carbamoyltransferase [Candidatus Saccharimonadales bacterium]|nr:aspartate carbamoyltransferase [Candidatus Saccharimonadales bacterium]
MKLRHVVSAKQFDTKTLQEIFNLTDKIKSGKYNKQALAGKVMVTLFYEPSTRTRMSFEASMLKLGGSVISTENAAEFSSAIKGETIEDTIRIVNGYTDLIVIRHPQSGIADTAAKFSKVPVINAGDGTGEHPTQALLDLYTIFSKFKKSNFTIAMVGELATYRAVHSLSYLLTLFPDVKFTFVSPKKLCILPELRERLKKSGNKFRETEDLNDGLKDADVVYVTRIQKERLTQADYKKYFGVYVIDKNTLKLIKKDAIIMHPLPRINEITADVDSDPRAIYFEEAQNGLYVRMAVLLLLFDKARM